VRPFFPLNLIPAKIPTFSCIPVYSRQFHQRITHEFVREIDTSLLDFLDLNLYNGLNDRKWSFVQFLVLSLDCITYTYTMTISLQSKTNNTKPKKSYLKFNQFSLLFYIALLKSYMLLRISTIYECKNCHKLIVFRILIFFYFASDRTFVTFTLFRWQPWWNSRKLEVWGQFHHRFMIRLFLHAYPKSEKRHWRLDCLFTLLDFSTWKPRINILLKSTLWGQFHQRFRSRLFCRYTLILMAHSVVGHHFYRVCHGFRLINRVDYFWVNYEHF